MGLQKLSMIGRQNQKTAERGPCQWLCPIPSLSDTRTAMILRNVRQKRKCEMQS